MIHYIVGDIFDSDADALVNTVNTMGIAGRGIALQFRQRFPNSFQEYTNACAKKKVVIGKMFVTREDFNGKERLIIHFPTKREWWNKSDYEYIETGMHDLIRVIQEYNISSIAMPRIGTGNGFLNWRKVKKIIENKLKDLSGVEVYIYEYKKKNNNGWIL